MKKRLIEYLSSQLEVSCDYEKLISPTKVKEHGDLALPCFTLAKQLEKNPVESAKFLEEKLSTTLPNFISKVVAVGPFLNFYFNAQSQYEGIVESILKGEFQKITLNSPQKILIEYPSPNTNKSLHIGHSRNMLLGLSLGRLLKKTGNEIIQTNLNNDRGISICYAMLVYEKYFSQETPDSLGMAPDDFVAMCYSEFKKKEEEFPQENLEAQAQEMLVKWESGDKQVRDLWEKLLSWVYQGYQRTYAHYCLPKFDRQYHESQIYNQGKDIVLEALKNKVKGFQKEEDGAVFVDLEEEGFGKKYLLRGNGTTLYMTQDLYLASLKHKEFQADKYVFIVGQEQEYHFKVLFELLGRLGLGGAEKNVHYAYGYVYDEHGKKFSSRLGNTIGADVVYKEMVQKAKENLLEKELTKHLDEQELEYRSKVIGFGALAFSFLKVNPMSSINFSFEKALSFEGETGPYCQYTYARIQSILKKVELDSSFKENFSLYSDQELALLKVLKDYPCEVKLAAEKFKPSQIANYVLRLSQEFNNFYQSCSIIKSETKELQQTRIQLAKACGEVIKDGLELLGIEVLEEM